MVKKITIYTAFGHFLQMVERQAEEEKEQVKELDTDRCPMDHPLSDYQNALQSTQDLQVRSCPVDQSVQIDEIMKKSASCPSLPFNFSHPIDPIQMTISPVPTSIESKKLNEATECMMSFWKVHVTSRKPKSEREEQISSIFEKLEGLFAVSSTTSVASMFGKFEEYIEEMKREELPKKDKSLIWNSPDQPTIPQLPVFVKSPVDSLKFYKGTHTQTAEMADDELSELTHYASANTSTVSSPTTSHSSDSSSSSGSTTTIIARPNRLQTEIRLQQAVIEEQKKIIDGLYSLQTLSRRLKNVRK
ncbi:hypothetical protein GCK72_002353 [Caenorhabditis remanei]|uniref:Uncharacterized protein n=1 Tax=Caenorhabditis remanei TaxID=31234 RepID=A0A6A5HV21_CAERE|nr:hypothetical protein GCK72_002353 [Caenorhabditis remanei]KAF1770534.1 hypothetical protein GCK72_002353 [Caenorhabditis remanei]